MPPPDAQVSFRTLAHPDLVAVGQLVSDSFHSAVTPIMVAAQHSWKSFVAVALDHPDQFPGQRLLTAELDGRTIGFVDFRASGDASGFLSYICMHSSVHGRGVARELLRECVRRSGSLTSVPLDVFEDNETAHPGSAKVPGLYESAREGMLDCLAQRRSIEGEFRLLLPTVISWSPHDGSCVFDPVRALDLDPSSFAFKKT